MINELWINGVYVRRISDDSAKRLRDQQAERGAAGYRIATFSTGRPVTP